MRFVFVFVFAIGVSVSACGSPFGAYGAIEDDDAALDGRTPEDLDDTGRDEGRADEEDSASGVSDSSAPSDSAPSDSAPSDSASAADAAPAPPVETGPKAEASCSVTLAGATGKEEGGAIPVCCTPGSADKAAIMEVFRMVNEHRAANGRSALVYDDKLESAIQAHCEHMKVHSFFSHSAPEGAVSSFTGRASKCGASAGGENIAWGYTSAASVMSGWKTSPGHNSNMLGGSWRRMAVGKSGTYWGQLFAP